MNKPLDIARAMSYRVHMNTKENEMNETSQERLNRMIRDAQRRLPVGSTITNKRGTARWNGTVWVYGR